MKLLLELFLVFAKCSAVTFGGGYAVLPILQREIVEDRHWATEDDLMDYYAISQVTPGMIAVNVATFIGLKLKGFWGGVFATLGTIFPSMVIISIIALFLTQFENNPIVVHAFAGIRACVCILILDAVIKLGKKSVKDKRHVLHLPRDPRPCPLCPILPRHLRTHRSCRRLLHEALCRQIHQRRQ